MVAVQLSGGLGNQMFEYALYLKLKSMGKEVKIDDFTCYGEGTRPKQLAVFGVSYERLSEEEYIALTDSRLTLADKIRRRLIGRRNLSYREADFNFDSEVLNREPALLQGCFQTERYFADISDRVREAFTFRNLSKDGNLQKYEAQIAACSQPISVHIRRGDYLDPKYSGLYTGICDEAYYERAITEMKKRFPDATFFFFSNDSDWVKAHYSKPDCVVVEGNDENSGYADMYLMSRCRHNIIANSSFSWWGAWLNGNLDKCIIAPKRWLNGRDCRDIYTKEMLVL